MLRLPGRGIGGRPVPWPPREQRIVPPSRGGRARRAAAEYQPGYDGLPGGAQGLRVLGSITIRLMITTKTLLESTKLATKIGGTSNSRKTTLSLS